MSDMVGPTMFVKCPLADIVDLEMFVNSTARRLPNPTLLRLPTLRREAQSTSALEGTYAPLADVLIADDEEPSRADLVEILNYVHAANHGFAWMSDGRPIVGILRDVDRRTEPLGA